MEYLKDNDLELLYHPRKVNVVVDALSRKRVQMSSMMMKKLNLIEFGLVVEQRLYLVQSLNNH